MFCRECGSKYESGDKFCSSCGEKVVISETYESIDILSYSILKEPSNNPFGFSTLKRLMDDDVENLNKNGTYSILSRVYEGLRNQCRNILEEFKGLDEELIVQQYSTFVDGKIELKIRKNKIKVFLSFFAEDDDLAYDWDYDTYFEDLKDAIEKTSAREGIDSDGFEHLIDEQAEYMALADGFRELITHCFWIDILNKEIVVSRCIGEVIVTEEDCHLFENWLSAVLEEETDIEDLIHTLIDIEFV